MAVEIISWSISTKVKDQAGMELVTPGSAVRHVTNYTKNIQHDKGYNIRGRPWNILLITYLIH